MKGLLVKNAVSIVKQNEVFIILLLLLNAIFMTILSDLSFLSVVTMFFTTVLILKQMSDEKRSGYSEYEKTLPVSSEEIVYARYLFGFGFTLIGAIVSVASQFLVSFLFDYSLALIPLIISTGISAAAAFLLLAVLLPVIYRYGTKPIGLINILIVLIPTAINYFLNLDSLLADPFSPLLIVAMIVGGILLVVGSVLLSVKIVKQTA